MPVVGFPIAKLFTLVIRQVSKPLANIAKERAKSSHFFRTYLCIPPAQFYHWCEVRMKMYVMNIGKSADKNSIPRLNEQAAIELGANLLGEGVIFTVAVLVLTFEMNRQKEKERKKEMDEKDYFEQLETRMSDLSFAQEELDTKIRELTRLAYSLQTPKSLKDAKLQADSNKQEITKVSKAIQDAHAKIKS